MTFRGLLKICSRKNSHTFASYGSAPGPLHRNRMDHFGIFSSSCSGLKAAAFAMPLLARKTRYQMPYNHYSQGGHGGLQR